MPAFTPPVGASASCAGLRARCMGHEKPGPGDGDSQRGGYLEAATAFAGTYNGRKVRGENYVEMTGKWDS